MEQIEMESPLAVGQLGAQGRHRRANGLGVGVAGAASTANTAREGSNPNAIGTSGAERAERERERHALRRRSVVCSAASGGVGVSTVAALLARQLSIDAQESRDSATGEHAVVLVDADFQGGGLDVLLGIEGDAGVRFGAIDAPLGRVEAGALRQQLVRWERVGVLPFQGWHSNEPEWWVTQGVLQALALAHEHVVVDVGRGALVASVPDLRHGVQVVVVELSVLGLARAQAHLRRLRGGGGGNVADQIAPQQLRARTIIVGVQPSAASRQLISEQDVQEYLQVPLTSIITHEKALAAALLQGLGLRALGRKNQQSMRRVAQAVLLAREAK